MPGFYKWLTDLRAVHSCAIDESEEDFAKHDKRFHGGHFDPDTMKCELRDKINGKMTQEDVVNVENEEETGHGKEHEADQDGRRQRANDDFESVCRESERVPEEGRRRFCAGGEVLSSGAYDRIAKALGGWLDTGDGSGGSDGGWTLKNPKSGKEEKIRKVDGDTFRKLFACCRTYLENGDQVDLHDEEFYRDGGFGIVSENGMAGFFITKEGDAVSGYSLFATDIVDNQPKRVRGGGFFKTIAPLMRKYAKTTDCFSTRKQNLPEFYKAVFGFKEAAKLDFNFNILAEYKGREYAEWFVKTYGESPVSFMVMTDSQVETKHFDKDDWDGAFAYQQKCVGR